METFKMNNKEEGKHAIDPENKPQQGGRYNIRVRKDGGFEIFDREKAEREVIHKDSKSD